MYFIFDAAVILLSLGAFLFASLKLNKIYRNYKMMKHVQMTEEGGEGEDTNVIEIN